MVPHFHLLQYQLPLLGPLGGRSLSLQPRWGLLGKRLWDRKRSGPSRTAANLSESYLHCPPSNLNVVMDPLH